MPNELSDRIIALVRDNVPVLEVHGLAITRRMYERMFGNNNIRDLFNQSHQGDAGSQPRPRAAIVAYTCNIEEVAALAPAVERIAQKHVGLNILPEHYPYVAEALLGAIKDVLRDAATDEILADWGEAYWYLAEVLIARERTTYTSLASAPGGWIGWRDFQVERRERESDIITSFALRPADGEPVLRHRPGQCLTFWLDILGHHSLKRNYSISSTPNGETYRITVKREPHEIVSGWLHDSAGHGSEAAPPWGEFLLCQAQVRPVVLVSGGVGLTPLMSMLETIADRPDLPPYYVHGTRDGSPHAISVRARGLAARSGGPIVAATFYERPRPKDQRGKDYDETGLISIDWLNRNTLTAEADYFLRSPKPFLRTFVSDLARGGMAADRMHYELLDIANELLAA